MIPNSNEQSIRRVALVSHDYNGIEGDDRWHCSEHFRRIDERCA